MKVASGLFEYNCTSLALEGSPGEHHALRARLYHVGGSSLRSCGCRERVPFAGACSRERLQCRVAGAKPHPWHDRRRQRDLHRCHAPRERANNGETACVRAHAVHVGTPVCVAPALARVRALGFHVYGYEYEGSAATVLPSNAPTSALSLPPATERVTHMQWRN